MPAYSPQTDAELIKGSHERHVIDDVTVRGWSAAAVEAWLLE